MRAGPVLFAKRWEAMMRTVRLPDGREVPAIGQGTWRIGEGQRTATEEEAALGSASTSA